MSADNKVSKKTGPLSSRANPNAKQVLGSVQIERVDSPVFQIADRIRTVIAEGTLAPGIRLPSTRELSDQFNVDPSSVHRALKQLVKEGLLVRTPYVGTFVAPPPPDKRLERLGFYFRSEFGEFARALLEQLTLLAHQSGFTLEVFSETRQHDISLQTPPADLLREAKSRRIQGLITGSSSPERTKWINNLPIPAATISTPFHPFGLNWNREEITQAAINRLIQRGCQRPGMITALYGRPFPHCDAYQMGAYNGYIKTLEAAGLPFDERRIIGSIPDSLHINASNSPEFAYESFKKFWDELPEPERPDGIFIYPDSLISGTILAATARGLKIPEDLKLVIHCNKEVQVFCPYEVDRLEVSVADTAIALVNHIRNQLLNRPMKTKYLPFELVPASVD